MKALSKDPLEQGVEFRTAIQKEFDSLGNVQEETQKIEKSLDGWATSTTLGNFLVDPEYDGLGDRLSVTATPGGYQAGYEYDALARIGRISFLLSVLTLIDGGLLTKIDGRAEYAVDVVSVRSGAGYG